ncbi:tigger transposable element-derived protein 5 [Trichinella spiralis]|uniref:tigger transposable element-derived protein 5 n=1 Tax=Trichinella spiralis TaxID=6334 RepID=UPI0001EFE988|nr:tigger transposable element-derived protein 5 [Trichinella spiralis]
MDSTIEDEFVTAASQLDDSRDEPFSVLFVNRDCVFQPPPGPVEFAGRRPFLYGRRVRSLASEIFQPSRERLSPAGRGQSSAAGVGRRWKKLGLFYIVVGFLRFGHLAHPVSLFLLPDWSVFKFAALPPHVLQTPLRSTVAVRFATRSSPRHHHQHQQQASSSSPAELVLFAFAELGLRFGFESAAGFPLATAVALHQQTCVDMLRSGRSDAEQQAVSN